MKYIPEPGEIFYLKDPEAYTWSLYKVQQSIDLKWQWDENLLVSAASNSGVCAINLKQPVAFVFATIWSCSTDKKRYTKYVVFMHGEAFLCLDLKDFRYLLWDISTNKYVEDPFGWKNAQPLIPPSRGKAQRWRNSLG